MDNELQQLTLANLAKQCSQESSRFFHQQAHDPRYCYELFRRAIVESDQMAWRLLIAQYRPLVTSWVHRHSYFASCAEDAEFFVNGAFYRLIRAVPPARFASFPNLKTLLSYLQLCVAGEIMDYARKEENTIPLDELLVARQMAADDVEAQVAENTHTSQLWELIKEALDDEREIALVYASYVLGLKPRELIRKYPKSFRNVQEVYRLKENVLARLRRDPQLNSFFADV